MTASTLYNRCADQAIFSLAALGVQAPIQVERVGKGVRLHVGAICSPICYSLSAFQRFMDSLQ